jgi:hypothetical protein
MQLADAPQVTPLSPEIKAYQPNLTSEYRNCVIFGN